MLCLAPGPRFARLPSRAFRYNGATSTMRERNERARVNDFDRHSVSRQLLRGGERGRNHVPKRYDRDIRSRSLDRSGADGNQRVASLGILF